MSSIGGIAILIEKYDLEAFAPYRPSAERHTITAGVTIDISDVLPYLNAILWGAVYQRSPNAPTGRCAEKLTALQVIVFEAPAMG